MKKILTVAWREFASTVFTRGFIIGIVMMPIMLAIVAGAVALMKNQKGPRIVGSVAIIDRSASLDERVRYYFSEQFAKQQAEEDARHDAAKIQEAASKANLDPELIKNAGTTPIPLQGPATEGPRLSLDFLPSDASADEAKKPLESATVRRQAGEGGGPANVDRIALIVIEPSTISGDDKGEFPAFKAYYADRLDFEVKENIQGRIGRAVVDVRLAKDPRTASLSGELLRKLMDRPEAEAMTVTTAGESKSSGAAQMFVPMAFMLLLMMSVFTSGQYLLTSTVEEKSNRVMEMLLSAVSPTQLMTGKILGYMGVGVLIIVLYGGIGIGATVAFALTGLIDPMQLVYFVIFFLIAFFLIASMMAAIGAAVNDMREAQTLMSPVMALLMIPWLTWFYIQRAPNSPLATILSFVPGPNPFIMVIRLAGSEPVPTWQIPVAILVGLVSVGLAAWAAGKVFRVGALMYGKPPNFKTLWRWIKMA